MPIKGLTDRGIPKLVNIGSIRKGDPAEIDKQSGKTTRIGKDLDHFRLDSEDSKANEQWKQFYGEAPKEINVYLPHPTPNENFQTWKEEWKAGGLVHRCDGEMTTKIRKPDGQFSFVPEKCPGGCKAQGRLLVLVDEWKRFATLTAITSSIYDLVELQSNLEQIYKEVGKLNGILFTLKRTPREVSCPEIITKKGDPNYGKPTGKRVRRVKNLLTIEPAARWVTAYLAAADQQMLASPTQRLMIAAPAVEMAPPVMTEVEHSEELDSQRIGSKMGMPAMDFSDEHIIDVPPDEDDVFGLNGAPATISNDIKSQAYDLRQALIDEGAKALDIAGWLKNNFSGAESIDTVEADLGDALIDGLESLLKKYRASKARKSA